MIKFGLLKSASSRPLKKEVPEHFFLFFIKKTDLAVLDIVSRILNQFPCLVAQSNGDDL